MSGEGADGPAGGGNPNAQAYVFYYGRIDAMRVDPIYLVYSERKRPIRLGKSCLPVELFNPFEQHRICQERRSGLPAAARMELAMRYVAFYLGLGTGARTQRPSPAGPMHGRIVFLPGSDHEPAVSRYRGVNRVHARVPIAQSLHQ